MPKFWNDINMRSAALAPLSAVYCGLCLLRVLANRNPYKSRIPLVCVGNLVAGGGGKTPLCVSLAKFLKSRNKTFCFLSKGYGGKLRGVVKIDEKNSFPKLTGDEPLILFAHGDTFVSKNRVDGLKYINDNFQYDYIIMDDGLQNPTFVKDRVVLATDGDFGFGNGLLMPAGPLRDRIKNIRGKIDLAIVTGNPSEKTKNIFKKYGVEFSKAEIVARAEKNDLNCEYVAFCGIGRPEKFRKTLANGDFKIKKFIAFGDHHFYTKNEIKNLQNYGLKLITTEKDWVRLGAEDKKNIDFLAIDVTVGDDLLEKIL